MANEHSESKCWIWYVYLIVLNIGLYQSYSMISSMIIIYTNRYFTDTGVICIYRTYFRDCTTLKVIILLLNANSRYVQVKKHESFSSTQNLLRIQYTILVTLDVTCFFLRNLPLHYYNIYFECFCISRKCKNYLYDINSTIFDNQKNFR